MKGERLAGEIARAVGVNGSVVVFPSKITIVRKKGFTNAVNYGKKGDKEIRLSKISSIQLSKPGITNGYIQIESSGNASSKRGVIDATKDENTVMISKRRFPDFVKVKTIIEQLIDDLERGRGDSASRSTTAGPGAILQWKELLDAGLISEDEFNAKKAEILSQ